MISYVTHGNFKKANGYLEKLLEKMDFGWLDKYGKKGVEALEANTPICTGRLASSWYYTIEHTSEGAILSWNNYDIENGQNIAIVVMNGHVTRGGRYVAPNDFVTPALTDIFTEILTAIEKEVKMR